MRQAQMQSHETIVNLLQAQMTMMQQQQSARDDERHKDIAQLYCERDKDRHDKDKDRLAQWGRGQQTLAMVMSTSNGTSMLASMHDAHKHSHD